MKYLALLLTTLFSLGAYASDITKVDLSQSKQVRFNRLNINQDRVVVLKGVVREHNVEAIMDDMKEMAEVSSDAIFLIINSPGGSVVSGFELINLIQTLKREKGLRTFCAIESEAFSMAALVALYCHQTFAHKYASIMFHEAAYGVQGLSFFVKKRVDYMESYLRTLDLDVASQMGISLEQMKEKTMHEWWLTAEEAAQFGVVDGVLNHLYYIATPPEEKPMFPFFMEGETDFNTVENPLKTNMRDKKGLEEK